MRHRLHDPNALAARYRAGLTLREIGAEVGRCHQTVRYHLRKLWDYPEMVTRMLLARFREAGEDYAITRTRAKRRRLKHTIAMLRQKRPLIYAQILDSTRPRVCSECSRPIVARARAGMWSWRCEWCGHSDFVPFRIVPKAKPTRRVAA